MCFHATTAPSADLPYGYLDRCEPARTAVTAGSIARAHVALVAGGGISGRVTTENAAQISFGGVVVFNRSGAQAAHRVLNDDGSYTVGGLAPGAYAVCFLVANPPSIRPTVTSSECYRDVVWDGEAVPARLPERLRSR